MADYTSRLVRITQHAGLWQDDETLVDIIKDDIGVIIDAHYELPETFNVLVNCNTIVIHKDFFELID